MNKNNLFKTFTIFLTILSLLSFNVSVFARSSSEIQKDIDAQQKALKDAQNKLNGAQSQLKTSKVLLAQSQSGLPQLEAEIQNIEAQINFNSAQLKLIKDQKKLLTLKKEALKLKQEKFVDSSYMQWRISGDQISFITDDENNNMKNENYNDFYTDIEKEEINALLLEIKSTEQKLSDYEKELNELNKTNKDLEQQKQSILAQISYYNSAIAGSSGQIGSLQSSINNIQSEIKYLNGQQVAAIQREQQILQNTGAINSAGCDGSAAPSGKFYICGNGRDANQGHGVGMSQYGANGMAQKGWDYKKILTFYYTGVSVVGYSANSNISIVYCADNPNYDTPPCDNGAAKIIKRISLNDYLGGLGEMPESWPIEARKAQMVAARTYALRYTNNGDPNIPICLTTSCQVSYIRSGGTSSDFMDNGDYQVALDTGSKVIVYGGSLISAVYSADNNQGHGTADNDTIWQNFSGYGSPYAYLRSVNDNPYAVKTQWTLWPYKTKSYGNGELDNLLKYVATSTTSGYSSSIKSQASAIISNIGKVSSLQFDRDASSRVKRVWFVGTNGKKSSIGGWWFKNVWNSWIYDVKKNGDYIYSQTFYKI